VARNLLLDNGALWALSEVARRAPRLGERLSRLGGFGLSAQDNVGEPHRRYDQRRFVRFNETAYAIPARQLPDALDQLGRVIRALGFATHFPLNVQFVAADNLWLSPSYQRDTAFVSARVYQGLPYEDYFAAVGEILDRHEGRPHWATIHHKTAPELEALYPRFAAFRDLRAQMDPRGVFLNPHLCALFGVESH
jgi:FAD/FMN-containing dehydrogenase